MRGDSNPRHLVKEVEFQVICAPVRCTSSWACLWGVCFAQSWPLNSCFTSAGGLLSVSANRGRGITQP